MNELKVNDKAPDFILETTNNNKVMIEDFKGKNLLLYFYPKDNTPGCTVEAKNFNLAIEEFNKLNTIILGISKDNIDSHQKFKSDLCLNFELANDKTGEIYKNYGVLGNKTMFGKIFPGIITRSTFLINKEGVIVKIWRKVNIAKHTDEVLKSIKELCV